MRIAEMNWSQVEDYLRSDDRCVRAAGHGRAARAT